MKWFQWENASCSISTIERWDPPVSQPVATHFTALTFDSEAREE